MPLSTATARKITFHFSPSYIASEQLPLLSEKINTNVIPSPTITTPFANPTSAHPIPARHTSAIPPPGLPRPITATRPMWNVAWAVQQAAMSGMAALLGWDMISGCMIYEPNPIYDIVRVCPSSNRAGILLSIILAAVSSGALLHARSHIAPRHPYPYRVLYTFVFVGPVISLLFGLLSAFTVLGSLGNLDPQSIAVLQVLSALCGCLSIVMAVVSNCFE